RNGISSACAIPIRVDRLGTLRPLSMKLICLCEIPVSTEISSWLRPRTPRHCLSRSPSSLFLVSFSIAVRDSHGGFFRPPFTIQNPRSGSRGLLGGGGL